MPSAEDVGAITRAVERRRLETGYLAIPGSRNGDLDENQKNNCFLSTHFSASMPHLPSRSNGPRDSAQSYASAKQSDKKRLFVESTEGMPTSISGLVNVAPGSSAASSLLMFPIDFTSTSTAATSSIPATNTTLMSTEQSCKQGAVPGVVQRKTRSSSISEIRQRLTRRLSRSSGSSNNRRRSGSSNSSPTTSPVSRSRGLSEGVQQSKRLFTGNSSSCSLIAEELSLSGKIQDSWSAADELVRGLESLSIDGRAGCNSNNDDKDSIRDNCNQDDEEKSTGRLLSESIYLVLEKRLNATTGFDSEICLNTDSESQSDDSKRIKDSGKADSDVFSTNGSLLPDPSTISESLSLLALSDGECREKSVEADVEQEAAGRDEDVVDYDDYVYLSTRKTVKSRNQNQSRCNSMEGTVGNEENSRPVSVGDGEYLNGTRKWWPRRVLPVHNMQYMPKLSKLFTEISQLKASNLSDIRNFDYTCTDCLSLAQPVDEAMMADAAAASLRDCRDIECRNYLLQNSSSSSSSSSATLKEWASSNSLSGLTLADICNGSCINSNSNSSRSRSSVSLDSKGNRKIDYWDILSRCPMRPTSSLALSSLKAMVKSSMASVSSTSSVASSMTFDAYGRRFNNGIGAPLSRRGSRRAGYSTDSSSSDSSDEDTDYSDEENDRRIKEDSVLREFLSSSNSSSSSSSSSSSLGHMRQRGQGNLSSSNGQSQRSGKQRQKRVLSEPMQYILYNSYLRYYGRQGES
ncbi:hypothetical protein J3B02_004116 [Coemansia erecta]|nr:hypothetical protein J3B02_004116 [Coemansia erecta]